MIHKIKAIECILDWNLWPRREGEYRSTNLKRMREAMEAGIILPPIIVNKDHMRVVDWFHGLCLTFRIRRRRGDRRGCPGLCQRAGNVS